jgi:DNA-binding winged helix-turn-helix (wHTH) protein
MPKTAQNSSLKSLENTFYQGKYSEVIEALGPNPVALNDSSFELKTFLQIGSLVFLGSFPEGRSLFENALAKKTPSEYFLIRSRFYLGIGAVRISDYSAAIEYFALNLWHLRKMKKQGSPQTENLTFYALQGAAFFRFFRGQFLQTCSLAQNAYSAAFKSQFKYGQVLALDLLGHSQCQTGSIRRGLYELEKGLSLAQTIGNGGIMTAITVSIVKYRAQFGLDIKNTISDLNQAILSLEPQDTYSRAELVLELIRQLMLRGKGSEAQRCLESASPLIHKHQNKRQSAVFNLRCAELLLGRGDAHTALALANSLKNNLNPRIDNRLWQKVNELITKICDHLENKVVRIYENSNTSNFGESPLEDILKITSISDFADFEKIKELELWGILPALLEIPNGTRGIYLGPKKNEMLIMNGYDIRLVQSGLTSPIIKLLIALIGASYKSKEVLIEHIWNYKYNPQIHDNLLHATIGKLRKVLGPNAQWVEWTAEGYRLAENIRIITPTPLEQNTATVKPRNLFSTEVATESSPTSVLENKMTLNIRQLKFINSLKNKDFIGVKQYAKQFKVCTMTACRDLSDLHKTGRVIRIGKGRATVYGLSVG